jgi:hypothetical protein
VHYYSELSFLKHTVRSIINAGSITLFCVYHLLVLFVFLCHRLLDKLVSFPEDHILVESSGILHHLVAFSIIVVMLTIKAATSSSTDTETHQKGLAWSCLGGL